MTKEQQQQRIKAITKKWKHASNGPIKSDIDLLLSLLDSAVQCLHCGNAIRRIGSAWIHVESNLVTCRRTKSSQHDGIYRAEPATTETIANAAATAMRDACVEKVKERAAKRLKEAAEVEDDDYDYSRALACAGDQLEQVAVEIQSLTLDQVQEKRC